MGLFLFAEQNSQLLITISGAGLALLSGGFVYYGNIGQTYQEWVFRSVPDVSENYGKAMDGKHFSEAPLVKVSYKKLLQGDLSYNNGNYLIYYGSQACPHCTKFIYGSQEVSRGNLWLERDFMSEGAWMKAYQFVNSDSEIVNKPKFLMFEDVPEIPGTVTNDDLWTLPWSTWNTTNLNEGKIQGEYIRNDKSARDFRKILDASISIFGSEKVGGTPTVIVYKNGIPKIFGKDKLPGLEDKTVEYVNSVDLELQRFIKYYYVFVK